MSKKPASVILFKKTPNKSVILTAYQKLLIQKITKSILHLIMHTFLQNAINVGNQLYSVSQKNRTAAINKT